MLVQLREKGYCRAAARMEHRHIHTILNKETLWKKTARSSRN